MRFVKNLTPPNFQAKNCTPLFSPNFNSFGDKNTEKRVKMETFTPLANILHCRRQWWQWQISPLIGLLWRPSLQWWGRCRCTSMNQQCTTTTNEKNNQTHDTTQHTTRTRPQQHDSIPSQFGLIWECSLPYKSPNYLIYHWCNQYFY